MNDELRYQLLSILERDPTASQRDIAGQLGLSVGKVNYCLRALAEKGLVKYRNFKNARNKSAYMYLLTVKGAEEKARITYEFLMLKMHEVDELRAAIEEMRSQARGNVETTEKQHPAR